MTGDLPETKRRLGLGVGVLTGFFAVLLIGWLYPRSNVEVVSNGTDLTRHGAARLVITYDKGVLADAACREGCDDLRLRARVGENSVAVRVLASDGRAILAAPGTYVDAAGKTRLEVAGRDELKLKPTFDILY